MPVHSPPPSKLALSWEHTCRAAIHLSTALGRPLGLADPRAQVAEWFEGNRITDAGAGWPERVWAFLQWPGETGPWPDDSPLQRIPLVLAGVDGTLVAFLAAPADSRDDLLLKALAETAAAELGQRLAQERWGRADDRTVSAVRLMRTLFPTETAVDAQILPLMCRELLASITAATGFQSGMIRLDTSLAEEGGVVVHSEVSPPPTIPDDGFFEQIELQTQSKWTTLPATSGQPQHHRCFTLPIISSAGHSLGALLLWPDSTGVTDEDVDTAQMMAGIGAGVMAATLVRTRDRLLNYVSHEMLFPISNIQTSLELILRSDHGALGERKTRIAKRALQWCVEAKHTATTMLAAARCYAGRLPFAPSRLAATEIAEEMAGEFQQATDDWKVTLEIRVAEGTRIYADSDHLKLILRNLIGNAIKFSQQGGRVLLSITAREGETVVEVEDEGPGIRPEDIEQIWRPFNRLYGTAGAPGSGIGLTLVKELVERHSGSVAVTPPPAGGPGSRFVLKFPDLSPVHEECK